MIEGDDTKVNDSIVGGDGVKYAMTDELCAKDREDLGKLIAAFEQMVERARTVRTYADLTALASATVVLDELFA